LKRSSLIVGIIWLIIILFITANPLEKSRIRIFISTSKRKLTGSSMEILGDSSNGGGLSVSGRAIKQVGARIRKISLVKPTL
jgi:hypothetical protein